MPKISSKDIQNRIRSMKSTRQITKAMELVATSKLRKAQSQAQSSLPYFETIHKTILQIAHSSQDLSSAYWTARPVKKNVWVVIAGDRGLAGGYNSNIWKLVQREIDNPHAEILPIGNKAADFFRRCKWPIVSAQYILAEDLSMADCFSIAQHLCDGFLAGEYDTVRLIYTRFVSVLTQTPESTQILPLPRQQTQRPQPPLDILFEPDAATVLEAIIPEYVSGILFGALCQSRASEQAARRIAMDSATKNASEMIDDLQLQYNQIRQAMITQQITEIVSGA